MPKRYFVKRLVWFRLQNSRFSTADAPIEYRQCPKNRRQRGGGSRSCFRRRCQSVFLGGGFDDRSPNLSSGVQRRRERRRFHDDAAIGRTRAQF